MPRPPAHRRARTLLLFVVMEVATALIPGSPAAPRNEPAKALTASPRAATPSLTERPSIARANTTQQSASLLVNLINVTRARQGSQPVFVDKNLVDAAQTTQANRSTIEGTSVGALIATLDSSWTRGGEIDGYAPSVIDLLEAALASEDHRSLLLDPDFTRIGIVVDLDDHGARVRTLLTNGTLPSPSTD